MAVEHLGGLNEELGQADDDDQRIPKAGIDLYLDRVRFDSVNGSRTDLGQHASSYDEAWAEAQYGNEATPNQNYAVDTVRKQINVAAHEKAESGIEPCCKESCDDEEDTLSLILAPNASRRAARSW